MPELPEVETLRRTLHDVLRGRRITAFQILWRRTVDPLTEVEIQARTIGQTILDTRRRGKLLILDLDSGGSLTVHLRMTGELLFRADATLQRDSAKEKHLRAVFAFSDGTELCFYDIRKFGRIGYISPEDAHTHPLHMGIEPLGEDFTIAGLESLLKRRRAVKPLLLDQTVVAGLGNIYVDEALFRAGIHPLEHAEQLTGERIVLLHSAIVDVLSNAIDNRGTTFSNYRSGLGEPGANQVRLQIYGRPAGSPCPTCGSGLERMTVGQRGTVLCPTCQPFMPRDMKRRSSTR